MAAAREFIISVIEISDAMEFKIRARRGVTGDEVREACVPYAYDRAGWEDHPVHGLRLLVQARTYAGVVLKIVLQPVDVDAGVWRLRTVLREGGWHGSGR